MYYILENDCTTVMYVCFQRTWVYVKYILCGSKTCYYNIVSIYICKNMIILTGIRRQ